MTDDKDVTPTETPAAKAEPAPAKEAGTPTPRAGGPPTETPQGAAVEAATDLAEAALAKTPAERAAWLAKAKRPLLILAAALILATCGTTRGKQALVNWLVAGTVIDGVHVKNVHVGEHSITLDPGGSDVIRWSATTNAAQAGDVGMNTTTGRPSAFIGGAAQKLGSGLDVFGDGADGPLTLAANLVQTRDGFYTNLTTTGAFNVVPAGTRVFVQGTLTLASGTAVTCNGNAGSGATAGGATAKVTLREGFAGGAGGNGAVGTAGGAQPNSACVQNTFSVVGAGGAGAAGGANAGGAAGTLTSNGPFTGIPHASSYALGIVLGLSGDGVGTPTAWAVCGGGGGGGGGGSAAGTTGGGGGGGGGVCVVAANTITGAGNITCNGGAGGNAAGAGVGGGGGGGGAGACIVIYLDKSGWTGTCQANGGAGGSGIGGGAAGTAGSAGNCILLQAS